MKGSGYYPDENLFWEYYGMENAVQQTYPWILFMMKTMELFKRT